MESLVTCGGSFSKFQELVASVANTRGSLAKVNVLRNFFTQSSRQLDAATRAAWCAMWYTMLLPMCSTRKYHLQRRQLIKLFGDLFGMSEDVFLQKLERSDLPATIGKLFGRSMRVRPASLSTLTLANVDEFLTGLSALTKHSERVKHFGKILPVCTCKDLTMLVQLVQRDLQMGAGVKIVLGSLHDKAYDTYRKCCSLQDVVARFTGSEATPANTIEVMVPVKPMLAAPCKLPERAIAKFTNGLYSEIKYDGERVQAHLNNGEWRFFSRSLKPARNVNGLPAMLEQVFAGATSLILDGELMKEQRLLVVEEAQPAVFPHLYIFDCLYYNGIVMIDKSLRERRLLLSTVIASHPQVSLGSVEEVHSVADLEEMMARTIQAGHEGLVLKSVDGQYAPGSRHWLKLKRDYLADGVMADSADLVVLGAWFGTGKGCGTKTVFLMGCVDAHGIWHTVTKVHPPPMPDDMEMVKILRNADLVPSWLDCHKSTVPDFVVADPKKSQVWEIIGAEFSNKTDHTAGISMRFPRMARVRSDKDWTGATSLSELHELYKVSCNK